jgi:hypothetical protein
LLIAKVKRPRSFKQLLAVHITEVKAVGDPDAYLRRIGGADQAQFEEVDFPQIAFHRMTGHQLKIKRLENRFSLGFSNADFAIFYGVVFC